MNVKPEVLAIIPARGGSKGIPRKNIKLMAGKPMIAYSIEEAKKSKYITRITVNTEDEEIAEVAKRYGAEIFPRPIEFAQDLSKDFEVFFHQLKTMNEQGYHPDIIVQLRPNLPCRTAKHIDECIEKFMKFPESDSVRSIKQTPKHPLKMWKVEGEFLKPYISAEQSGFKDSNDMPNQALPKVFNHTAAVDVINPKTILEKKSMTGSIVRFVEITEPTVNIDDMMEFALAEQILLARKNSKN